MNKNRMFILIAGIIFVLACSITTGTQPPAQPTQAPLPTFTPYPTYTPYPTQVVEVAPTATQVPQAVQATAIPFTPSSWFGRFRWFGSLNPVTLVIQKVNGNKFEGAMYWTFTQCRITEAVDGDIYTDITTAPEQNRWALHPDFQNGDKGGTWLRWTQNESIGSTKCYLTISGDWWYGHINSKGHMTGIHFTNSTNTVPDKDATFDFTLQQ